MTRMVSTPHFHFDREVHATKGPKGDTAFLHENYKTMSIGSVFRTPKARFTSKQVHAGAKKAGFIVEIREEGPWLRVQATGKIAAIKKPAPKKSSGLYLGAGEQYPPLDTKPEPEPDIFS